MMNKKEKPLSIEEMKKIELDILNHFVLFCDNNNLHYSLCGGTLLGAVRHKGFIPWDDDIDLFIPRETYIFLCKHFNKWGKKRNLKLINYYCHGYYSTFAKIIDTSTKAMEDKRNEKIGVWIDLFIVDYVKSNIESFSSPITDALKTIRFFGSDDYFEKKTISVNNIKRFINRIIKKPLLRFKIESFIKNNKGTYNVAYSFADQIKWWETMETLDFKNYQYMGFEGKEYKVINNWENYLIHRYGSDYMTPPPLEKRETHPLSKCVWINNKGKH